MMRRHMTVFLRTLQKNVVNTLKEDLKKKMQDAEAPAFSLKDVDGNIVSLADFKGKTVVIDFWATYSARRVRLHFLQ